MAYRLRQRGLYIKPDDEYEDPRIEEIAKRQYELHKELEELDSELFRMYRKMYND